MSRPSSSRAAELLAQRAQYLAPASAANLIATLRKSSKRDLTTRVKAINELKEALKAESDSAVFSMFVEHFAPVYVKAALFDSDWRVRAGFHEALALVTAAVGREIAPWLKTLLPVWVAALFDPAREASSAAFKALEQTFPEKEKRQKAVFAFAPAEIVDFVSTCIAASPQTLNAMAVNEADSAEDQEERYRVVVSACLGLVELYMTEFDWSGLKIWEVAKTSPDFAVQAKAMGVLKAALEQQANLAKAFLTVPKKHRLEIASLLEHEDVTVSNAALSLLLLDVWLEGVSIEGFLSPKLLAMVDKGRLSDSLAAAIDHFHLNEKAITKLIPLFQRSDFNALATIPVIDFYTVLLKDDRAPTEVLELLVNGELLARGKFTKLVTDRWTSSFMAPLLRGSDVGAIADIIKTLNTEAVTDSVVDELVNRGEVAALVDLVSSRSLSISVGSVEKPVNLFRTQGGGKLGLSLLARGAIDRSEVFAVMSAKELVDFAVENGADSLPPLILDHIDYGSSLTTLYAIPDLCKLISVENFIDRMSGFPVQAATEVLLALCPALNESDTIKIVELWQRAVRENDETSERLLRERLDLQTLIPQTLRTHLAEDPILNTTWISATSSVGLAFDRIRASPETIDCFARLASVNPTLATKIFNQRVDLAAHVLAAAVRGQDWFFRDSGLLDLFSKLDSLQVIFDILVEEYLVQGERTRLLAVKELFIRSASAGLVLKDSVVNLQVPSKNFRLCLVALLTVTRGCVVDAVVRSDVRAILETRATPECLPIDKFALDKLKSLMSFQSVAEASLSPTAAVLSSDAGVVVGAEVCGTWPAEELVKLAISAATNDRLVLDAEVAAVLINAVRSAASVMEAVELLEISGQSELWREATLFRLLTTEEKITDLKQLEESVGRISDVYQFLAVWSYVATNLDVADLAIEAVEAAVHAAVLVASEAEIDGDSLFAKLGDSAALPDLHVVAMRLLARLIFRFPATIARWYEDESDRALKAGVERLLRGGLSQAVIARHLAESNWETSDGDLTMQFSRSARQLVANFQKGDLKASLLVTFPETWPLRVAVVELSAIPGASKAKQQFQVLAVRQGLQQSTIPRVLGSWGRAVGRVVEGVEDCYICYSVVHSDFPNSLPSKKCATCKNAYHKECIYRWFRTSGKTLCPICQSPF